MKFLRFLNKGKKPRPDPAADGKRRQMEALISAATSIQNYSFNGQARHFLTARHGRRVRIPALTLYYEADGMWLTALKLARELGDRKSELKILFLFGRLQHEPPSKSILFPGPVSPGELVDLVRTESARAEEKGGRRRSAAAGTYSRTRPPILPGGDALGCRARRYGQGDRPGPVHDPGFPGDGEA